MVRFVPKRALQRSISGCCAGQFEHSQLAAQENTRRKQPLPALKEILAAGVSY
jgi:hypothetical protein